MRAGPVKEIWNSYRNAIDLPPNGDFISRSMLRNALLFFVLLVAATYSSFGHADAFHPHSPEGVYQPDHRGFLGGKRSNDDMLDCATLSIGHCFSGFFVSGGVDFELILTQSAPSYELAHQTVTGLCVEADLPPPRA